jgi:hypothetical protein
MPSRLLERLSRFEESSTSVGSDEQHQPVWLPDRVLGRISGFVVGERNVRLPVSVLVTVARAKPF